MEKNKWLNERIFLTDEKRIAKRVVKRRFWTQHSQESIIFICKKRTFWSLPFLWRKNNRNFLLSRVLVEISHIYNSFFFSVNMVDTRARTQVHVLVLFVLSKYKVFVLVLIQRYLYLYLYLYESTCTCTYTKVLVLVLIRKYLYLYLYESTCTCTYTKVLVLAKRYLYLLTARYCLSQFYMYLKNSLKSLLILYS